MADAAEKPKVDMKLMLKQITDTKNSMKTAYKPLLDRDRKIGEAFDAFDKAVESRKEGGT